LLKRECKVIPGAMETVGLLSAANLRQWIATSSASSRVAPTLEATGLLAHFPEEGNHWFSAIITKPDPEVYVRSVAAHGFCPENVASVEDSPTGVSAAVSAGMGYIIAFTGGSHIPKSQREAHGQKLLAAGAHIVVDDLRHIPTVITAHNARQEPTAGPRPQPLPARAGATEAFRYK